MSSLASLKESVSCDLCSRDVGRHFYNVATGEGEVSRRCLRCALAHPHLVRRSLAVAAIVGTLLIAINQGDAIAGGDLSASLAWKVPLTFVVPYSVATFGALSNARRRAGSR